ncbi:hypothetical protein Goshw_027509 [Gossypium schwendimanii]|uniref:RNase H type-1 domain-containing protein n=1 Tax=Gossypium schwendimanii TaxID=34291 RepID=A0A7J9N7S5_GOSSC|nr:hypothetical protein [Gossypium schwendimanii]
MSNFQNCHSYAMRNANWSCFFGTIAWRIWKNRNLRIFLGTSWSAKEIVKNAYSWATHYLVGSNGGSMKQASMVDIGEAGKLILLRLDEIVKVNTVSIVAKGVLRDQNGKWVIGFNRRLGNYFVFEDELWEILDVRRITQLLQNVHSWSFEYIPREENSEADRIAKLAFDRDEALHLFEESPFKYF